MAVITMGRHFFAVGNVESKELKQLLVWALHRTISIILEQTACAVIYSTVESVYLAELEDNECQINAKRRGLYHGK